MSIDANVLDFSKELKEELRMALGLLNALVPGYDKAFSSILDSNVTTFMLCDPLCFGTQVLLRVLRSY